MRPPHWLGRWLPIGGQTSILTDIERAAAGRRAGFSSRAGARGARSAGRAHDQTRQFAYALPDERFAHASVTQHNRRLVFVRTHAVIGCTEDPYRFFPRCADYF